MTKTEKKAILGIIVMTLVWGGTFPLIKILLNYISPAILLMYRFFFSALLAIPFFIKKFRKNKKNLLKIIILGIILYIAYLTQTIGLEYTTSSKSAFITGLYIIFTPIFALFFIREKLTRKLGISLIFAITGLALLANISLKSFNLNFGDFITIISAITFSLQIVLTNIYAQETDIIFIAATQMIVMFLVGLPFNGNFLQISLSPLILLSLIFLGSFAGFIAILAETYSLKYLDPDRAVILFTLEPIFAGIFSFILLHERLSKGGILGVFLLLVAMCLAATSKVKKATEHIVTE